MTEQQKISRILDDLGILITNVNLTSAEAQDGYIPVPERLWEELVELYEALEEGE
jgi:hypothetical protein